MFDNVQQLIDTLRKVEALHAGAMTPGERGAAEAAIERIKKRLEQFVEADPPQEIKCTFSNHWSKRLFCALAKRYDLHPYRYYRQRHTTVMLRVPRRFLDEVLWPEFVELDDVLEKYLDEITTKIISETIFKGSAEEEIREQPLIESEVKETQTTPTVPVAGVVARPGMAKPDAPSTTSRPASTITPVQKVGRNDPCPCGSGRKYKKCCIGK